MRAIHHDVRVTRSRFHDNLGDPLVNRPTGNGVNLGEVDGGLIERCVAWNNGIRSHPGQGPVGIWAYDSNNVTIQFCESYANRTSGTTDGGGFDLDINMTASVVQYNYSHDNDGAGIGLYQGTDAVPWRNNVVRYNVSENDGRRNNYGAITVWTNGGPFSDCDVYGNTIYVAPSATGAPRAIRFNSVSSNFRFFNNLVVTTGGVRVLDVIAGQTGLVFRNNDYFTSGGAFSATWSGTTYTSLGAWSAGTGQERDLGALVGRELDPQLTAPGMGGTIGDPDLLPTLNAYRLRAGSPMINAGLDLARVSITPGGRDFYGSSVPQGGAFDIGAHEYTGTVIADAGVDAAVDVPRDVVADVTVDVPRDVVADVTVDVPRDVVVDLPPPPPDVSVVDVTIDDATSPADVVVASDVVTDDAVADAATQDAISDGSPAPAPPDGGCQCGVPGAVHPSPTALAVLAALAAATRRRRKR